MDLLTREEKRAALRRAIHQKRDGRLGAGSATVQLAGAMRKDPQTALLSMGVDDAITDALRNKTALPNAKLEALRDFTLSVVRDRGFLDDSKVQAFLDAGYSEQNILDVILGYSQKVMSNYTNHFANTPIDKPFQKFEWQAAA